MNALTVVILAAAAVAVIAAVAVLAALGLLFALFCAEKTFGVPKFKDKDLYYILPGEQYDPYREELTRLTREALELPCEDVYIKSFDGIKLHGRYYHTADGAPVQLMMHGYHGLGPRDFCGGIREALAAGYNALVPDERAHWGSKGKWLSYGINERYDCRDWVKYISDRFGADTKIILYGISMGAGTVLMASELELPGNVRGIIADCGYNTPEAIIKKVMGEMGLPVGITFPMTRLGGRIFGKFDICSASPLEAMKRCRYPVLLIHGEDDRFVPFYMSKENYEACVSEKKHFLAVPGAGHGLAYMVDSRAYVDAVSSFAAEIDALPEKTAAVTCGAER